MNTEISPPNEREDYDNSSKSRGDLTNIQISPPSLKFSNRENQTDSQHLWNTSSQTDISSSPPRVKSSQTDVIQNRGVGVQVSSVPSKISRSQLSDTHTKMTGPPPHLIKKIKNRTRKIEKISPKIHENMNVSISPVIKNKNKKKQSLTIYHLQFKDRRII